MLNYSAPLRDMQFVLNELIGFDQICALAGTDDISLDLSNAVLEEASKFSKDILSPLNRIGDLEGSKLLGNEVKTPKGWKEAYTAFKEAGWCSLAMSPEFGGQGFPKVIATAVYEMWDSANMSFSLCPLLTNGAIEAIYSHGNDNLKSTYLEKLVSGEWAGTMNLTEPQAGSDLSAVRTQAVPEGTHYRIKGQKIYITYGEHDLTENIIHLVLARTPDAPEGIKGISLFVVPKFVVNESGALGERNDVKCISLEHKLGIHASPTAVMSYGEDTGALGYLVGEENNGLMYMFTMMNAARHAVGREGMAISESSFQLAYTYATTRIQGQPLGGGAIIRHPDVKRMLMTMKSKIEAMRALTYTCAFEYDLMERHNDEKQREQSRRRGDLLTPIVKGWCTEVAQELTSLGVQVHGGMGFIEETGAAQFQRDARITTIYEGTTGIQAGDLVGRKTLRDGGRGMEELITDILLTVDVLDDSTPRMKKIKKALAASVDDLKNAVAWLVISWAKRIMA
jgi:3-(methylthio)propanoyl-CoA dehydrogenase